MPDAMMEGGRLCGARGGLGMILDAGGGDTQFSALASAPEVTLLGRSELWELVT